MIDTSIQRVQINQVIENQLPEFVQSESPLFVDFMKQYYISQEYQGGSVNISENIDRYTKLQTYVGAALTEYTGLSTDVFVVLVELMIWINLQNLICYHLIRV